ncbi:conjugal transfer protein [Streptomyces xanthophaeus]|uniref:conjugal transfer protein n=1 Tax=Streptomyces xanthophaeus TaxID=67385 RepID=UPI00367AEF14
MPDSPAAAAVKAMAPAAQLPRRPRDAAVPAVRVVPLRSTLTPTGWTVVVAALANGSVPSAGATPAPAPGDVAFGARYFAVSGTGGQAGVPLAITGSPAEVAAPVAGPTADSPFTHQVPSGGPLSSAAQEFLKAYLAGGQGAGLERYLSPGVQLSAPAAAAYGRVDVAEVAADAEAASGKDVPADGVRARVRVRVTGEDRAGARWPLEYRLEVTARAGRWEISGLDDGVPAAPVKPAAETAPSASVTATVTGGAR